MPTTWPFTPKGVTVNAHRVAIHGRSRRFIGPDRCRFRHRPVCYPLPSHMTATPPMIPEGQVVSEFRQRRTRQWLAAIPGIVAVLLLLYALDHPGRSLLGVGTNIIAVAAGTVFVVVPRAAGSWAKPSIRPSASSAEPG
jgi:hypothetical protein